MSNNTVIDGIKLIDTGNTVIDAANLDLAVLEKDGEDDWCTMLYMKNGNKYKTDSYCIVGLKAFCIEGYCSDKTTTVELAKKFSKYNPV